MQTSSSVRTISVSWAFWSTLFFNMWICMEFLYLRWRQLWLENGTDIMENIKLWSLADVDTCSFSIFNTDLGNMGADWAMTKALSVVWGLYSVTLKNAVSTMAESITLKTQKRKKNLICLSVNCFNSICIHSSLIFHKYKIRYFLETPASELLETI